MLTCSFLLFHSFNQVGNPQNKIPLFFSLFSLEREGRLIFLHPVLPPNHRTVLSPLSLFVGLLPVPRSNQDMSTHKQLTTCVSFRNLRHKSQAQILNSHWWHKESRSLAHALLFPSLAGPTSLLVSHTAIYNHEHAQKLQPQLPTQTEFSSRNSQQKSQHLGPCEHVILGTRESSLKREGDRFQVGIPHKERL